MKNVSQFNVYELSEVESSAIDGGKWHWGKFILSPLPYAAGYVYGSIFPE